MLELLAELTAAELTELHGLLSEPGSATERVHRADVWLMLWGVARERNQRVAERAAKAAKPVARGARRTRRRD